METDYKHCMTVFDDVFKIDFIVWKRSDESTRYIAQYLFKIDFIVWKHQ